jgi:membrane associated rhomboid family serine protease
MDGRLSSLLSLQPSLVFHLEWWRVFTFPLATDSIEGTILFLFTFFIFAPKLEEIFRSWLYPLILFLIVFLQGAILTLLLWNCIITITGMEGLSFFVLTVFTLINIKKKLVIFNKYFIRTFMFSLGMFFLWFTLLFFHSVAIGDYRLIFEGVYSCVFGISTGLVFYLQIRYTKSIKPQEQPTSREPNHDIPKREELSYAVMANNELRRFNKNLREELAKDEGSPQYSEDKLNEILDKINENGKESLSPSERKFLDDYSNLL